MKVNNKMNMSNIFISFVLVLILGNQIICMEQDFKKQRKDEDDENKELVMQPLTLKMSCLNIYKTLNPPSDALSWALGFITSKGYSPDLKIDILRAWNPESIEAASEILVDYLIKDIFCYNLEEKAVETTSQDVELASLQDIKFTCLLIKKLSIEHIEKLINTVVVSDLFSSPVVPHLIKCEFFVKIPQLQTMGIARQLLATDTVTKEVIAVIGSLIHDDKALINLLLTVPLTVSNEFLLRNYFLDEYKKGLETYTFYAQVEPLSNIENSGMSESMLSSYQVAWNGEKIIIYHKEREEEIADSYKVNLTPVEHSALKVDIEFKKISQFFISENKNYIQGHCVLLPEVNQLIAIFNNPGIDKKIKYIAIFDLSEKKCIASHIVYGVKQGPNFIANIQNIFFNKETKKIIITLENGFCYSIQLPLFLCDDFDLINAALQFYLFKYALCGFMGEAIIKQYTELFDPKLISNKFIEDCQRNTETYKRVITLESKEERIGYCNRICEQMDGITIEQARDKLKAGIQHFLSCKPLTALQESFLQLYQVKLALITSCLG